MNSQREMVLEVIKTMPEPFTRVDFMDAVAQRFPNEMTRHTVATYLGMMARSGKVLSDGQGGRTQAKYRRTPGAFETPAPKPERDLRNRVERDYAAFRAGLDIKTPDQNDAQSIRFARRMPKPQTHSLTQR